MNERKDVYKLPAGDTTLEWYSKAVIEMKKRKTTDPTSWNYQAGMHGFNPNLPFWQGKGPFPDQPTQTEFWNQCQHGSWFFLPWHRMYLAYFEQIVAQTIVDLKGPKGWTLPFWNYSDTTNPHATTMPPAFTNPANATNGLWIEGRESTMIPAKYVSLKELNKQNFTGDGRTSPLGFGGPETAFSHSGNTHGALESLPHDVVHAVIGGAMGDPRTAALDPIFWLHHCNIDRLWQVWINMGGKRADPIKSSWQTFKFSFHDKDGKTVQMMSSQVEDTTKVLSGYTYQGVPPTNPKPKKVGLAKQAPADFSIPLEVVAATNKDVTLGSQPTTVQLPLSPSKQKVANFKSLTKVAAKPQTEILHFENVTGQGRPPVYDVYLNAPQNAKDLEPYFAGAISFFGVEEASTPSLHSPGSGQHYALDVTDLVNKLRSLPNWKEQELDVSLEPTRKPSADAHVKIGRISLYSE